jgi:hypothetical protein
VGRETNRQRRERQASTAREKAAAARATHQQLEQRRRAKVILSSVLGLGVVIALIVTLVITNQGKVKNNPNGNRTAASQTIVNDVTGVSPATYNAVGQGNAQLIAKTISDPPLTQDGKPELLFVGAEFCPFCAAERWSIIQALSRFGTFDNLNQIRSATDDGNLATFSFYKSSYSSKYLAFVPVEDEDRSQAQLQTPTKAEQTLWTKYTTGFPFLYFGGKYVQINAGYTDTDLSGLDWTQITADLKDPTSSIAKDILGEANVITAMVCKMTNGQGPAGVCTASGLSKITPQLGA